VPRGSPSRKESTSLRVTCFMVPLLANRWAVAVPPIWLVGIGALLAALTVVAAWGVLKLIAPRMADEAQSSLRDGFLGPLVWLVFSLAAIGIALTPAVNVEQIGRSLTRLLFSTTTSNTSFVAGPKVKLEKFLLEIRPQEIEELTLEASGPLTVRTAQPIEGFALVKLPDLDLSPNIPWKWSKAKGDTSPFIGTRAELELTNESDTPITLLVKSRVTPEYPQTAILPWTWLVLVLVVAAYSLLRLIPRRVAAVASATTKEAIGQPIFSVALIAGTVLLITFIVIPYNTFGEDVKMLKDSGLTLVKVLALLVVVWSASVSVAEEIEGRTALTVLSKPINRRQFVLGKFAGLILVVLLLFLILGSVLMFTTSLKVVYDAREGAKLDPTWRDCADEMITVVPGLVLSLFEAILLAAVSLAVSTRLGMVANLIICFTVYALGHLVPLIVQSSVGKFAIVRFVGQLFATILPVLEHFTIEAAVVGGIPVPWSYLAWAALYAGLYSTVAILVALVLFQDRDLA